MSCPKCSMRLTRQIRYPAFPVVSRRALHISAPRQRLGAATYQQEWQTGTYHYNKQTTKNFPVASKSADQLLRSYLTMQNPSASTAAGVRTNTAARRKEMNHVFATNVTAKDYGNKIVLDAFYYDYASEQQRVEESKKVGTRSDRSRRKPSATGESPSGPGRRRGPARGGRGGDAPQRSGRFSSPRPFGQGSRRPGASASPVSRSAGPLRSTAGRAQGGSVVFKKLEGFGKPRSGNASRPPTTSLGGQ